MREENAKYLIVNSSDITKQLYKLKREFSFNDFENIYYRDGKITATEIFAQNNVPEEFQKIIIKISTPIFSKKSVEEFTTGFPFDFKIKNIEEESGKKYIRIDNSPIYHDGSLFADKFIFRTEFKYNNFGDVMILLENMYQKGCLESYLQAVKQFFDISLDLGLLFDAWHETHNTQKTLKLYKHKVVSKSI